MGAQPTETVIIVHGTFASEGEWWKPKGDFCERLDAQLAKKSTSARCWQHLIDETDTSKALKKRLKDNKNPNDYFIWDGANSQLSRLQSGHKLALYLKALFRHHRTTGKDGEISTDLAVHLIGHSHGGNVILEALRELDKDLFEKIDIKSVVLMGTPVLESKKRRNRYYTGLKLLFILFILCELIIVITAVKDYGLKGALEEEVITFTIFVMGYFIIWKLVELTVLRDRTKRKKKAVAFGHPNRMFSLLSRYDEAFHLLNGAVRVRTRRSDITKNFSPLSFSPFAFKNRKPLREIFEIIAYNFRVCLFTLRVSFMARLKALFFGILSLFGSFYIIFVAILDMTVFRFLSLANSWVSRTGLKAGLKSMTTIGLGDDADYMRISGVAHDFPLQYSFGTLETYPIPMKLQKRILEESSTHNSDALENVFEIIGTESESESGGVFLQKLKYSFSGDNTIHCSYYKTDEVISIIADIIADPDHLPKQSKAITEA